LADPNRVAYVTQTTLSVDDAAAIVAALRERFPAIVGPRKDDICYATQNRQDAVTRLTKACDVVIVVGSPNSSNSNRLREVATQGGARGYLVDRAAELDPGWFVTAMAIGVTAGASAPEVLVAEVIESIKSMANGTVVETDFAPEGVVFPLPKALA
jgi:4-hydroxy-3-methylbut-2-enyl diphosphate reductase